MWNKGSSCANGRPGSLSITALPWLALCNNRQGCCSRSPTAHTPAAPRGACARGMNGRRTKGSSSPASLYEGRRLDTSQQVYPYLSR